MNNSLTTHLLLYNIGIDTNAYTGTVLEIQHSPIYWLQLILQIASVDRN